MRIPDSTLIKTSLLVSIIGLIGLLIIFLSSQATLYELDEAQRLPDNENVRVEGTLASITTMPTISIITINNSCTLTAITSEQLTIPIGTQIEATGTLDTYKGQRQLRLESLIIR